MFRVDPRKYKETSIDHGFSYFKKYIRGRGAYATVHLGYLDNVEVAVKKIEKGKLDNGDENREIESQNPLQHENVVKILAVSEGDEFRYIALELCDGDLQDVIDEKYQGKLPQDEVVLLQIAKGLEYIHSQSLVHRDIKPGNILIRNGIIKISDFGFSKQLNLNDSCSMSGFRGTALYAAPEVLRLYYETKVTSSFRGSSRCDIFSAGCVFFVFLTRGTHPFGKGLHVQINISENKPVNFKKNEFDSSLSLNWIIRKMIEHDPKDRISANEISQGIECLMLNNPQQYQPQQQQFRGNVPFSYTPQQLLQTVPIQNLATSYLTPPAYGTPNVPGAYGVPYVPVLLPDNRAGATNQREISYHQQFANQLTNVPVPYRPPSSITTTTPQQQNYVSTPYQLIEDQGYIRRLLNASHRP